MARLYYQGHGSLRITARDGRVMYADPYAGDGYEPPADIVLISHGHGDHNRLELITQKPGCRVITNDDALSGGTHNSFDLGGITVRAVTAQNKNHDPKECVGFIITVDGVLIYASGDTSATEQMREFSKLGLDYAILCCDGIYNMNPDEAAQCAELIGAAHNIPVHMKPGELFDSAIAAAWTAPNKLIIAPGEEIELVSQ